MFRAEGIVCLTSSSNGSSIHLTAGNTSASVVLTRVYEAVLIDMSSTGVSMGTQLQIDSHKYEMTFTFQKVEWQRSQNAFVDAQSPTSRHVGHQRPGKGTAQHQR